MRRKRLRSPRRNTGIEFEGHVADGPIFVPPERLVGLCSEPLEPVRQFASYKGQPNKPGYFYWNGQHLGYESRLELSVLEITAFLTDVRLLRAQPFRMHFGRRIVPFAHVPDLLVARRQTRDTGRWRSNELVVIDVKGSHEIKKNRRTFELAHAALAEAGVTYAIAVEPDPVILRNIQFLRGYQFPSLGSDELVAPLTEAVADGPLRLDGLVSKVSSDTGTHSAIVRPALFQLLYVHELTFDVAELLSGATLVGAASGPSVVATSKVIEPWLPLREVYNRSLANGRWTQAARRVMSAPKHDRANSTSLPAGHFSQRRVSWTVPLEECTALRYDGAIWEIRWADRRYVKLRRGTTIRVVGLDELFADPDFSIVDGIPPPGTSDTSSVTPELVFESAREAIDRRTEGIRLMLTGYRMGTADPDGDGLFDDERFHPAKSLTERRMTLAQDFHVNVRTIIRWENKFKHTGAVCDGRQTGTRQARVDRWAKAREAARRVQAESPRRSKMPNHEIRRLVRRELQRMAYDDGDPSLADQWLPRERTLSRLLDQIDPYRVRNRGRSQKSLRAEAETPKSPYHPVRACRPFEIVEIDSTPCDCLAANPVAALQKRVALYLQVHFTFAVDQYTHKILAWRFTVGPPDASDAALLLYDLIYPKHIREGWPAEECQWSYSVPEYVAAHLDPIKGPITSAAFGVPTSVTVDHGSIFKSHAFREACRRLGIGIQYARIRAGWDKSLVERTFGSVNTQFLASMPGYKGSDVHSRGDREHVELANLPWVEELEVDFGEWVHRYHDRTPIEGLSFPGRPELHFSPNDLYEHALTFAGLPRIPVGSDVFIELLPSLWRTIQADGIQFNYLNYQGSALVGREYVKSPVRAQGGKWEIKCDRRDRSTVYFWSPLRDDQWEEGTWERLTVRGDDRPRPFGDKDLSYAKLLLEQRKGVVTSDRLMDIVDELLDRRYRGQIADRHDARLFGLWLTEQSQRHADQMHSLRREGAAPPTLLEEDSRTSGQDPASRASPQREEYATTEGVFDAGPVVEVDYEFTEGGDEELEDDE